MLALRFPQNSRNQKEMEGDANARRHGLEVSVFKF